MKVLIIGCGLVGKDLASHLRTQGHTVVGTTTRDSRIDELTPCCDEVHVLKGADRPALRRAAEGCDAIVVCAGPAAQQSMTAEQRRQSYYEVLVETAQSVVSLQRAVPIVALSSLSVYADGHDTGRIDESSGLTKDEDPSSVCFQEAEKIYLEKAKGQACVFRCADIMGANDPPIELKVKMAHQIWQGSVPFHESVLYYRVHQKDVILAIEHALKQRLTGIYNLTHRQTPPSNKEFFGTLCDQLDLPRLKFRNELKGPMCPVSTQKLQDTGFELQHSS